SSLSCLLLHCLTAPPALHSFPTRRSSDLAPAVGAVHELQLPAREPAEVAGTARHREAHRAAGALFPDQADRGTLRHDRRSLGDRSEEHTSELQSRENLVCRLLLEKKKNNK